MKKKTQKTISSNSPTLRPLKPLRIGVVVPHMFMHRDILPRVIFSPGVLALELCEGLQQLGAEVTLFSPGPVDCSVTNITADLSYFETELAGRGEQGDSYLDLLKKHPFTFVTLARQVQAEIIAKAYAMANDNELDIVHIYTNEEDTALPFAKLCTKPVVFTHHDPFNFLVKYKNVFPKYKDLNWVSMSYAQRKGMPQQTNWVDNIYHGISQEQFIASTGSSQGDETYVAYLGRLIKPKGAHLAIAAVKEYNALHPEKPLKLKIAGKHYSGQKDSYWQESIQPELDDSHVEYIGFIDTAKDKQQFLANARALLVPSTFAEPFGMVMIESLACGTPVIGLDSGAIAEVIDHNQTGLVLDSTGDEQLIVHRISAALDEVAQIDRAHCRKEFEDRFTLERMCREHLDLYQRLAA